ncbi:MAG: DUF99 family protein [Chromatiales bacterium]|jgi:endonuclease V-like protein UPF0215 family
MSQAITHVVGFDDAPFLPSHRGDVRIIGAVFCRLRLEGVLQAKVRRDGRNATSVIAGLVQDSRYFPQLQCILLQGITLAGFNVVDIHRLHDTTGLPVVTLARHAPDLSAIQTALLNQVPGGRAKWRLIERAGPMEAVAGVHIQRAGISLLDTGRMIAAFAVNSLIPEPLRTAHLIAAGLSDRSSHKRV